MKRHVERLGGAEPDVLVVGGGIHGAWAALEATRRGLRAVLVERNDFGSGASANSLKIVHGGFRHLANARFGRMRRSARERARLMTFAPELVASLPCMLRTWRRPGRGRPSLWAALTAYRALSAGTDVGSAQPGRLISTREVEERCPALRGGGHTGGAVWHEGQLLDSERFVLAVLAAAAESGAVVANYAEASTFVTREDRVVEVEVRDRLHGGAFAVRPRLVYNATNLAPASLGDWWSGDVDGGGRQERRGHATGFNVIVDREMTEVGVGLESGAARGVSLSADGDSRMFFMSPWLGRTLFGTGYVPAAGARPAPIGETEVSGLLEAFNAAAPRLELSTDDVTHLHVANLPAERSDGGLRLAEGTRPYSRRPPGGENVVGALAPKYTTARLSAVRGIDECERRLGRRVSPTATEDLAPCPLPEARPGPGPDDELGRRVVRRAVAEEMAVKLGDLLLRRTNLGAGGPPRWEVVRSATTLMADELGWDREDCRSEIRAFRDEYPPLVRPDFPIDGEASPGTSSADTRDSRGRSSP